LSCHHTTLTKEEQAASTRQAMNQFSDASKGNKVECGCGKHLDSFRMFRCLYCGVYHCQPCAEEHFGQTREEFKQGVKVAG